MSSYCDKLENEAVYIDKAMRARRLLLAAVFFAVGAVMSLYSFIDAVIHTEKLTVRIADTGISEISALGTWVAVCLIIMLLLTVFCTSFAVSIGVLSVSSMRGKRRGRALSVITRVTLAVKYASYVLYACTAIIFAVRTVIYTVSCFNVNDGIMVMLAVVFSEPLCFAFYSLVYYCVLKLWTETADAFGAVEYIALTEKITDINHLASPLLLAAAIVLAVIAAMLWHDITVSVACFSAALASGLLASWLGSFKTELEWISYKNSKIKK